MIFELSKKGTLPTFSRLQNEVKFPNQLNSILDLKYPTGITYHDGAEGVLITREDVIKAISLQDVNGFNKVLEGSLETFIFGENKVIPWSFFVSPNFLYSLNFALASSDVATATS